MIFKVGDCVTPAEWLVVLPLYAHLKGQIGRIIYADEKTYSVEWQNSHLDSDLGSDWTNFSAVVLLDEEVIP